MGGIRTMQRSKLLLTLFFALTGWTAFAAPPETGKSPESKPSEADKADAHRFEPFRSESITSNASVTIGGRSIAYQAIAGTLIVHPKGWDDVPRDPASEKPPAAAAEETVAPARRLCGYTLAPSGRAAS
jgi:hypothetical protein